MLNFPSVHPSLLAILMESLSEKDQPTIILHDSWATIVEEAIAQRTAPLLLRWTNRPTTHHRIPIHLLAILQQHVIQHAAWNLLLSNELRAILAACERQGMACIPLRGPVFAERLYGDDSIRQMDDLDVLVHREDLPSVKDLFRQLGYGHHEQRPGFLETFSYSLEFIHPQHGLVVEPHWTLAYPPFTATVAMQPVWARAKRGHWMEMDTWDLSYEDLLLHLCLHLHHKGQQAPLLWFHELATVIQRHGPSLDWNLFMDQAQLMEQAGAVADVLKILIGEFRSTIPDPVVRQLMEQPRAVSSPSAIRRQILARSSLRGREEFALLCSLQSLQQQLLYLSVLLFPSPEYMTRRYGTSNPISLVGFYIFRFLRIVTEGVRCAVTWIAASVTARHS